MASMNKIPEVTLVGIAKREDGMYVIVDAGRGTHYAADERGLGATIAAIVADPEMPRSKVETNETVGFGMAIARRIVGQAAPNLMSLVDSLEPAAHAIANHAASLPPRQRHRKSRTRTSSRG